MRLMKKLLIFGLLALMTGCGNSDRQQQSLSHAQRMQLLREDSLALKVAVTPTLDALPLYVAADRGLFDSLGVSVHLKPYKAQMDCDTAFRGGSVEGMTTDLVRAQNISNKGTGVEYATATELSWQLITNRIDRIKEVSQLSDRMIALAHNSGSSLLADIAVSKAKPKYDVFRIPINDVNLRLRMLLGNEMNAVMLPEPQATTARLMKHRVLADSRKSDIKLGVIAFRKKDLADTRRKEQVRLFLKAYDAAVDSINRFGLGHYSAIICKHCNTDQRTVDNLPKIKFNHSSQPRQKDIVEVKKQTK